MPLLKLFLLSVLAGFFIAMSGAVTNTAAHSIDNVGVARMVCGLLFPFGLAMVVLTGSELFTGNTLITISVLDGQSTVAGMLRSWAVVYLGNAAGAILVAAGCAFGGQLNYSGGQLAVFSMKLAIGEKIALLRKTKKLTQTELAEYLFLTPQTISRWEVGSGTPEITLLPRIATFFGVSISSLG